MRTLSEAQWKVLSVLWKREANLLGEVYEELRPITGWSRTTVHTYLTRMERKALVRITRESEPHRYSAAVTRAECARIERDALLHSIYEGETGDLIAAFLKDSKITEKERNRLRALLDGMEV